jgi:CBS domain-containing protein
MRVRDLYSPGPQVVRPDQALAEAARTMLENHVGSLVVVETRATSRRPVGIVTDRDIVRGQLRLGADLFCLTVGEVMTPEPLTISAHAGATEAIASLRGRGVRRAPVVDSAGNLMGVVALDDLLPEVARELEGLSMLLGTQARHERKLTA